MQDASKVQISVALIGCAGVIAAALIGNWSNIFGRSDKSNPPVSPGAAPPLPPREVTSASCLFKTGTLAGKGIAIVPARGEKGAAAYPPDGSPCHDQSGNSGIVVLVYGN